MNRGTLLPPGGWRGKKGRLAAIIVVLSIGLMLYVNSQDGPDWDCSIIDPSEDTLGDRPCFRARLSRGNLVTLEWRVAETSSGVTIYDDMAIDYDDIGHRPAVCASGAEDGCATTLRISEGGAYRWVLRAGNHAGEQVHASALLKAPLPHPPRILGGGGFVDALAPDPQVISWEADRRNGWPAADTNSAWIEVLMPDALYWSLTHYPRSGPLASLSVPAEKLARPGDVVYRVRDCRLPAGSTVKYCSPPVSVGFKVGYDRFVSVNHQYVPAGEDLEIAFTAQSGDLRLLSSDTLVPPQNGWPVTTTRNSHYRISGERLTPGRHRIALNSCIKGGQRCSNQVPVDVAASDGMAWHMPHGFYEEGQLIATVVPADGSKKQKILAPASGQVVFRDARPSHEVKAGDVIAVTISRPADELYILVDAPVEWQLERDYLEDFAPGIAHDIIGPGQALDVAFDQQGGIWQINEFSNNVEHVNPGGRVRSLNLPLARDPRSRPTADSPVTPFSLWMRPDVDVPTSITSLAERAVKIDSQMWFTQGGGLQTGEGHHWRNHSRIVAYNPSIKDSPRTVYNDRLCVYNVPADDPRGYGNNQVIGLTAAAGRIWLAESRGLFNEGPSYLSSFIPDPGLCENLLNFGDAEALPAQDLQYCGEGRTPEQDGCMERIEIAAMGSKVAHLETDPVDDAIWFSEASGRCLGRLDAAGDRQVRYFPFDDMHRDHFLGQMGLGGFPWRLQVDEHAVYIGEYATRHILRFDKASETFDEIALPHTGQELHLHSLVIDRLRQRLWFTLANETEVPAGGAHSTVGYVDLASWNERIERPQRGTKVRGVIYGGLDSIAPSPLHPAQPQGFRGIAFDEKTGRIALATMRREQITVLTPLPGFWP